MNTPNISVLEDTVVVKLSEEPIEKTEASLYLPESMRDKYMTGRIVVAGDDIREVSVGTTVVFHKDVARKTNILGDELVLVKERNIFFKIVN